MKKLLIIILSVYVSSLTAQEIDLYEPINFQRAVENGTRSVDGKPGPNYWQNHTEYDIEVRLDTSEKAIKGKETVIYYNESPDTLTRIVLRLYPNRYKQGAVRNIEVSEGNVHQGVALDTLTINSEAVVLEYPTIRTNGTNQSVMLQQPLAPGESLELYCEWEYPIAMDPEFRREGYYKNNAWFIGYFYPQIAVYDDLEYFYGVKGWDIMRFHEGIQEFYNDINNFKVQIEVPEGYFVWATGEHINTKDVFAKKVLKRLEKAQSSDEVVHVVTEEDLGDRLLVGNKWVFEAEGVTDFGFGAALNYLWDAASIESGDKRVFVDAAYPVGANTFSESIDIAISTIKYTSEVSPGLPYPYPTSTSFNGNHGGGMEFPMIANNSDSRNRTSLILVTFHEIFHNYMPFMMGFNEKRYPFMDEGWTNYYTDKYLLEEHGIDVYTSGNYGNIRGIGELYSNYAQMVDFPLITSYSQISDFSIFYFYYIKPTVAYNTFVSMVGEEPFNTAMDEFVNRWRGKHPTAWDFFYTMNDALGKNYNWYWKAWFFDLAYPDLALEQIDGSFVVKRKGPNSLPLPIEIEVIYIDESTEVIRYEASVWGNGVEEFQLEILNSDSVKKIELNTADIPDINPVDNRIVL